MPGPARCRSCDEEIRWQKNEETGKNVPWCLAHGQSHFRCCPQAKDWSKKGSGDRSGTRSSTTAQPGDYQDADGDPIRVGDTVEVVESDTPAGLGVQGRVYFVGPKKNGSGTIVAFNPLDAPTVKVYEPPHHVRIVPAGAKPASQSAGGSATAPPAQTSPRAAPAAQAPAAPAGSGGATTGAVPPVTGSGLSAPAKTPGKGGYGPPPATGAAPKVAVCRCPAKLIEHMAGSLLLQGPDEWSDGARTSVELDCPAHGKWLVEVEARRPGK